MISLVDVSLGAGVDAEERRAHGCAEAGQVDDGALFAFDHLRQDEPRHFVHADDVATNQLVHLKIRDEHFLG
jgi:hypothetical protein